MDSREPQTAAGLPGPAWPRPEPTDPRVEYEAIRHQIDSIDVDRNRGGFGDSVSIRCTCGQTYERGEFSDHVATMVGRLFTGPNHCTCFEATLGDLPGFSLCAWHESLFASAKAEAADTPAREPGIDVERLIRAIGGESLGPDEYDEWWTTPRLLAEQIAADYARLAASDAAEPQP